MTDTEKKIAEIREGLEVIKRYDLSTLDNIMMPVYNFCVNAPEWLRFLLSELERLEREYAEERAAHKAHVAQLCRVEEDNRKRFVKIAELVSERERLTKENRKLREERDKLIEGLRLYANPRNWYGDVFAPPEGISDEVDDGGQRARDILKEIGVMVE